MSDRITPRGPAGRMRWRQWQQWPRRRPLPLYLRLWLAVVLAVALLTLLVGWAWKLAAEPPLRDVVLRDSTGRIIGHGHSLRSPRAPADAASAAAPDESDSDGDRNNNSASGRDAGPADTAARDATSIDRSSAATLGTGSDALPLSPPVRPGAWGPGPAFVVRLDDGGPTYYVHLPRPKSRSFWSRPPFGFFWTLALVGLGVALATYPIVRQLTRGLERLQSSVERWGAGDLSARAQVTGSDETAQLARRFNHAAERIEALVAAHKSLLANASHELRSPLARIRMGLELLHGGGSSTPTPALKREIERSVAELDQLIEEILLASRLDAREADLGRIEAVDLVALAAEECAHTQAEFEIDSGNGGSSTQAADRAAADAFVVPGVARLLRRAVRNLLENARRYGGDSVRLQLARAGGSVRLTVSDRGPGIAADERERIFEPFYRARGASERSGGVGLGLALVKSITERHGGSVRCEAHAGGGASFVLELPAASAGPARAAV